MKRSVQILLLFTCFSLSLAEAREETMEERKRRVMRKYLRERMDITYSETSVPETSAEDEEVLDSEKLKKPQVDMERQEPGMPMPPPPLRQPTPLAENRNWLLSEDAEIEDPFASDDPYADPFAPKESKDEPEKKDWTAWGAERDLSPRPGMQRESRFNQRDQGSSYGQQPSGYDSARQGIFNLRNPSAPFAEGMQSGFSQQEGQTPGSVGGVDPSREKTFGPIFNQGGLQSPFPRATEPSTDRSYYGTGSQQPARPDGYSPYKSPYQTQHEQRRQPWGGDSEPKQEYRRQDTFQRWKEKNQPRFDPTSDDAFIEEKMPKTRR